MSRITVWHEAHSEKPDRVADDGAEIAGILAEIGVRFERWPMRPLPQDASPDSVLTAYAAEIARLRREGGYATADVIRLPRGTPNTDPMRRKFLDEHTHAEDEVRVAAAGAGGGEQGQPGGHHRQTRGDHGADAEPGGQARAGR